MRIKQATERKLSSTLLYSPMLMAHTENRSGSGIRLYRTLNLITSPSFNQIKEVFGLTEFSRSRASELCGQYSFIWNKLEILSFTIGKMVSFIGNTFELF